MLETVPGFKRIYHKEEFQRTEHFFDDEEANRIAESFGLSEAKEGSNQGTKGDKRKYHGVRTEHLDGKKLKNEYGTRDGYDKGQQTTYKDHEKHNQHSNYGKSMSQSHGSTPHHHESYNPNNAHGQHQDYHPNHNYHGSYSSTRQNVVHKVPTSVADHIGNGQATDAYRGTIVSAPMATSFTVTEYTTMPDSFSTPDPSVVSVLANTINRFPMPRFAPGNFSEAIERYNRTMHGNNRRKSPRKEPREKKMFLSPKYRPVKEEEDDSPPITTVRIPVKTFKPVPANAVPYKANNAASYPPPASAVSYPTSPNNNAVPYPPPAAKAVPYQGAPTSRPDNETEETEEEVDEEEEEEESEEDRPGTPYAPNFRPRKRPPPRPPVGQLPPPPPPRGYRQGPRKPPPPLDAWRFQQQRHKRPPRPPPPTHSAPMQQDESGEYSQQQQQQVHLTNEPLAISLRHSSAYNRLGQRERQIPHMDMTSYHDISTRKSDISVENNDMRNETEEVENNDSAHYFNHNQRYAKNHLTSTLSPDDDGNSNDNSNGNKGVRNTLMDPEPGVYSTIIKVLPATMLNVSESPVHRENGYGQHPNNALTASGNIVSVTRRPKSHAEIVSITTAFPQLQHHPPQHRPFIPKNRWMTLSLNLENPEFKPGSEFGSVPHPFPRQSRKMTHIMRGIKNGLLKPFGRGPFFPHHTLVASPSMPGPSFHMYGKGPGPVMNRQPPPHQHMQHNRPRPYHIRHLRHHQQLRPHSHSQFPPNYGGFNRPMVGTVGIASQSSLQQPHTVPAPPPPPNNTRPKFYYNYKPNGPSSNNGTDSNGSSNNNNKQQPELRTAQVKEPTTSTSSTSTTSSSTTSTVTVTSSESSSASPPPPADQKPRRLPQNPPFMNGLMNSVSDFFGKVG